MVDGWTAIGSCVCGSMHLKALDAILLLYCFDTVTILRVSSQLEEPASPVDYGLQLGDGLSSQL